MSINGTLEGVETVFDKIKEIDINAGETLTIKPFSTEKIIIASKGTAFVPVVNVITPNQSIAWQLFACVDASQGYDFTRLRNETDDSDMFVGSQIVYFGDLKMKYLFIENNTDNTDIKVQISK